MPTRAIRSTTLTEKLDIYRAVSTRYRQWYVDQEVGGRCLYWSLTLMGVLLQRGYRALIQAGSMSWPIVPTGQDDGQSPTHFSYEWSPWREESQAALKLGLLPEIHVWVGLPEQSELLDFATRFLPEQAAKEGLVWRTPQPPAFLWCGPSELPEGVIYKPDLDAIGFILDRISKTKHTETNPTTSRMRSKRVRLFLYERSNNQRNQENRRRSQTGGNLRHHGRRPGA